LVEKAPKVNMVLHYIASFLKPYSSFCKKLKLKSWNWP